MDCGDMDGVNHAQSVVLPSKILVYLVFRIGKKRV